MQIGPLIPTTSFRDAPAIGVERGRPSFAEHLRRVARDVATVSPALTSGGDREIPFGQYLSEVNRVDREAAWVAEAWASVPPARGRMAEVGGMPGLVDRARAGSVVVPVAAECRPAAPVVVAAHLPPLVLHRGARIDLVG